MSIRPKLYLTFATAAATLLAVCSAPVAAGAKSATMSADPGPTVVATGLLNPRGLAFAPNGKLYVAEAGSGGASSFDGMSVGLTSRISSIDLGGALPGTVTPVLAGLISAANPDGTQATGADGLSIQGGRVLTIMTGFPQLVAGAPPSPLVNAAEAQLGHLIKTNPGGQLQTIADVGGFDYAYTSTCGAPCDNNPQLPFANPYGVLGVPRMTYVADAGANTLDLVRANGSVQVLAYVHAQANDFLGDEVPTCVALAGGQIYVGTLNGNVFRYNGTSTLQPVLLRPDHGTPPTTPPIGIGGCTGDAAGNLYLTDQAAEFFGAPTGVYKMAPDGSITFLAGVDDPSGIVMGPDGNLYVSQNSTSTDGQVVRLSP
jgi:hypothetical protein